MLSGFEFEKFVKWQMEKPKSRYFEIKVGKLGDYKGRVWVFDTEILEGQFVEKVEDIDLDKNKREKELEMLKSLEAKYGINHDNTNMGV